MFKHVEIRRALEARIEELSPGDLLPQERDLAHEFDASRATVRQALRSLIGDGLVYSVRGRGTFVADRAVSIGQRLSSFSEDMRSRGLEPSARLLEATEIAPSPSIQRALNLRQSEETFRIKRLRLANRQPMCIETVYLPTRVFPRLLESDLDGSLYETMAAGHHATVYVADQKVTAILLDSTEARLLAVEPPASALLIQRVGRDRDGVPIEYAESRYRGDRYDVRLSRTR